MMNTRENIIKATNLESAIFFLYPSSSKSGSVMPKGSLDSESTLLRTTYSMKKKKIIMSMYFASGNISWRNCILGYQSLQSIAVDHGSDYIGHTTPCTWTKWLHINIKKAVIFSSLYPLSTSIIAFFFWSTSVCGDREPIGAPGNSECPRISLCYHPHLGRGK